MITEAKKILQANRDGISFGMRLGAGAMQERILALPGMTEELRAQVRAINADDIKVKQ